MQGLVTFIYEGSIEWVFVQTANVIYEGSIEYVFVQTADIIYEGNIEWVFGQTVADGDNRGRGNNNSWGVEACGKGTAYLQSLR